MAAGKKAQRREWTKEDIRMLKSLAREETKTTANNAASATITLDARLNPVTAQERENMIWLAAGC